MKGHLSAVLIATAVLSSCGRPVVDRTPEALEHERLKQVDPDHALQKPLLLASAAETQVANATVVAADAAAGTITLRHSRRDREDWPDFSLTLRAQRALLRSIAPGDVVDFQMRAAEGAGEIIYLRRRPR